MYGFIDKLLSYITSKKKDNEFKKPDGYKNINSSKINK